MKFLHAYRMYDRNNLFPRTVSSQGLEGQVWPCLGERRRGRDPDALSHHARWNRSEKKNAYVNMSEYVVK
jgi:hypothetical protein